MSAALSLHLQVAVIYMCTRLIVNLTQVYTPLYLVDTLSLSKVCSHTHTHTHTHTHHTHTHTCTHAHTHTHTHTHVRTHTRTRTHAHTHTHTRARTHTHTCIRPWQIILKNQAIVLFSYASYY